MLRRNSSSCPKCEQRQQHKAQVALKRESKRYQQSYSILTKELDMGADLINKEEVCDV
jgi:hypothetical protein